MSIVHQSPHNTLLCVLMCPINNSGTRVQVSLDDDSCYCSNSRLGGSEAGQTCYCTGSYLAYEDGVFYCQHCHRDYDIYDMDGAGEVTTDQGSWSGQSSTVGPSMGGISVGTQPCCCPYCGHKPKVTTVTHPLLLHTSY